MSASRRERSRDERAIHRLSAVDQDQGPTAVLLYLHATLLLRPILVEPARFRALLITPIRGPSVAPRQETGPNDHYHQKPEAIAARRAHAAHRARPAIALSGRPRRRRGDAEPGRALWIDRLSEGLADTGETAVARRWRAHRAPGRPPCRREVHPAARASRPSCPRRESGSRACCRPSSPHRPSPSASPPSRSSRSTIMWPPASCPPTRPRRCARPSHRAPTSSSRAAPPPARPR
jgi:hypothetical protein